MSASARTPLPPGMLPPEDIPDLAERLLIDSLFDPNAFVLFSLYGERRMVDFRILRCVWTAHLHRRPMRRYDIVRALKIKPTTVRDKLKRLVADHQLGEFNGQYFVERELLMATSDCRNQLIAAVLDTAIELIKLGYPKPEGALPDTSAALTAALLQSVEKPEAPRRRRRQ